MKRRRGMYSCTASLDKKKMKEWKNRKTSFEVWDACSIALTRLLIQTERQSAACIP